MYSINHNTNVGIVFRLFLRKMGCTLSSLHIWVWVVFVCLFVCLLFCLASTSVKCLHLYFRIGVRTAENLMKLATVDVVQVTGVRSVKLSYRVSEDLFEIRLNLVTGVRPVKLS